MDPARRTGSGPRPALIARIRRWLRPPRILRPTRAGWCFFAITFGVGFAALNTGNNLLYLVLSLMLAFLVLSGVLSESALRGIRVRRRLPRELFAGLDNTVVLEIRNTQRRVTSFAVVVEDRTRTPSGLRGVGRVFVLRIGPGDEVRRTYRLRPIRRGELDFTEFEVSTRFPFGLFSKSLTQPAPQRVVVYPEVEPARIPHEFGAATGGGESVAGPGGSGSDVSGLRDYRSGDPMRRLHWRASLRTGELLVRDVESEHQAEVEVRLRTGGARAGQGFERAVTWAASEVVALLDADRRVALRTDETHIEADAGRGHRARVLAFLARVEPQAPFEEPA